MSDKNFILTLTEQEDGSFHLLAGEPDGVRDRAVITEAQAGDFLVKLLTVLPDVKTETVDPDGNITETEPLTDAERARLALRMLTAGVL